MMKKKLLTIWDVDKTLYDGYAIIDFGIYLEEIGKFEKGFTEEILNKKEEYKSQKISYENFAKGVYEIYGRYIYNKNLYEILQLSKNFWKKNIEKLYPASLKLYQFLNSRGSEHASISGSSFESLYYLMDELGFVKIKTTEYETVDGNFSSKIVSTLVSHPDKSKLVDRVRNQKNKYEKVVGVGDNEADLAFLELVDLAIVIGNHDRKLTDVAKEKGWIIIDDPYRDALPDRVEEKLEELLR